MLQNNRGQAEPGRRGGRAADVVGSVRFLLVAPGTLAVLVPFWVSGWREAPPLLGFVGFRVLGALLIAARLPVLLDSFARFVLKGLGTPAPIAPPERLVVTGLYRHVRNPIYLAVTSLIVGQALFFGDVGLLEYGLVLWAFFHLVVLGYEEYRLMSTTRGEGRRARYVIPKAGKQAPQRWAALEALYATGPSSTSTVAAFVPSGTAWRSGVGRAPLPDAWPSAEVQTPSSGG